MKNSYGILEWANENSNSSYPLSSLFELRDFLVDASFVQFDGFVPTLKNIAVSQTNAVLTLILDIGEVKVTILKPDIAYSPGYSTEIRNANRHLGYLVFGQGLPRLFETHLNTTIQINTQFLPSVVCGINPNGGVYSIQGYTGDVEVYTGPTKPEQTLFFDVAGNDVTWNAGSLTAQANTPPLKTLNGVKPILNAAFIADTDILKLTTKGDSVQIDLVGSVGSEVISPTQTYE